ncbi:hypothetical protein C5167_050686 [Papaver somniferum]|uniref:DUF639 domain-containing protein n=1 Tax=Papaver somniferum TaxID=3469 RepID=A0A4Y7KPB9_PAPSO|nr:uncharacterized protein LOC113303538 [Papaver somniferum]RZC75204.1 hypothetical protein C5167_050686 [Papaver somniferum]
MENSGIKIFDNFIKDKSFKSIFRRKSSTDDSTLPSPKSISVLSPIANSVVSRCSRILQTPTEELQKLYENEYPAHAKQSSIYARNLLEFCSYQALYVLTQRSDYLSDKEFVRLSYDMMLAWEAPGTEPLVKETVPENDHDDADWDGWSLFYSDSISTAVQVDAKKTVGPEAFARIAPACAAVADIITVHNLFSALTSSSGGQLHFLIYDKYLGTLDKVIKSAKNAASNLELAEGEIVLDVDGTVPTQPVLQHIGLTAWPGRLTLTNYALYFESLGVGLYEKAVRYDLATDLKQVVKPELTGPLGARVFDKAVMYKSTAITEPVFMEFTEFKGNSRRNYWLEICLEILYVHKFIRKNGLKENPQMEALGKAILCIFRQRAVREAFRILPSHYKTLLPFNLAEKLPGGDMILETLLSRLKLLTINSPRRESLGTSPRNVKQIESVGSSPRNVKQQLSFFPISILALTRLGFKLPKGVDAHFEAGFQVGDVCVGEKNPLEMVVHQSKCDMGRAEAAQATVDQVKVDGLDTNIAVMMELLFPVIELFKRLQFLAAWEDPFKSTMFLMVVAYTTYRGWIRYVLPCICVFFAALMVWRKHRNKGKSLEVLEVMPPPSKNAVEQLLMLQEGISQFESLVQAGNIVLLKIRAILFAALPRATDKVALALVVMAAVLIFTPLKYLIILVFLEAYTRQMPLRKDSNDKWERRVREWWFRIPAAPVQLIKSEDKKKK